MKRIILFDGVCNLCNSSVQFIIKRDPNGYFQFASLQGRTGQELIEKYRIEKDLNSLILIENEKYYTKSRAIFKICSKLKWPWKACSVLSLIPKFMTDYCYDIIAKNRYKWFGEQESCMLPSPKTKNR